MKYFKTMPPFDNALFRLKKIPFTFVLVNDLPYSFLIQFCINLVISFFETCFPFCVAKQFTNYICSVYKSSISVYEF